MVRQVIVRAASSDCIDIVSVCQIGSMQFPVAHIIDRTFVSSTDEYGEVMRMRAACAGVQTRHLRQRCRHCCSAWLFR